MMLGGWTKHCDSTSKSNVTESEGVCGCCCCCCELDALNILSVEDDAMVGCGAGC